MEISIKKSELTNIGSQIIGYYEDLENYINQFSAIIDNINTIWNGADALKYINVMKERNIMKMNELNNIIYNYGKYLEKIPDVYSALDEAYSSEKIDV